MKETKFLNYPEVIFKGVFPENYTEAIEWAGRQSTATKSKGKSKQFVEANFSPLLEESYPGREEADRFF